MQVKVSMRPRRKRIPIDPRDGFQLDNLGRIKFHPDFHPNHGKKFSDEELCYLAKFYKFDGRRAVSFALGRPEGAIQTRYLKMLKRGELPRFKSMEYYC